MPAALAGNGAQPWQGMGLSPASMADHLAQPQLAPDTGCWCPSLPLAAGGPWLESCILGREGEDQGGMLRRRGRMVQGLEAVVCGEGWAGLGLFSPGV